MLTLETPFEERREGVKSQQCPVVPALQVCVEEVGGTAEKVFEKLQHTAAYEFLSKRPRGLERVAGVLLFEFGLLEPFREFLVIRGHIPRGDLHSVRVRLPGLMHKSRDAPDSNKPIVRTLCTTGLFESGVAWDWLVSMWVWHRLAALGKLSF